MKAEPTLYTLRQMRDIASYTTTLVQLCAILGLNEEGRVLHFRNGLKPEIRNLMVTSASEQNFDKLVSIASAAEEALFVRTSYDKPYSTYSSAHHSTSRPTLVTSQAESMVIDAVRPAVRRTAGPRVPITNEQRLHRMHHNCACIARLRGIGLRIDDEDGGLHYPTALTSCGIVAGNARW